MSKLSLVIPVLNQISLAKTCYKEIWLNTLTDVEFVILDNGSDEPIKQEDFPGARIHRLEVNIGVYPTFKIGMEVATGEIVAFFHSDLVVFEKGWDLRVIETFEKETKLGLLGFIGSTEIDIMGGRGGGTTSNFTLKVIECGNEKWLGSDWRAHGTHLTEYKRGAVLDGCSLIFRRECWNEIGYRENFPPHHFYDRLISTQILERGWHVGILGIECGHISGGTVGKELKYDLMAEQWCNKNLNITTKEQWIEQNKDWHINRSNPSRNGSLHNWDSVIYMEAEKRFLQEYRDKKHLLPYRI